MSSKASDNPVDLDQIRELIDLLIEKEVNEFAIERDGVKVKIRRESPEVSRSMAPSYTTVDVGSTAAPATTGGAPESPGENDPYADCFIVTSPMVGTLYRAPEPGADAFADVGAHVSEGQTLCIVEAMKLMNEIVTEAGGEVVAIFASDGEPVEFGQRLFAIRPGA